MVFFARRTLTQVALQSAGKPTVSLPIPQTCSVPGAMRRFTVFQFSLVVLLGTLSRLPIARAQRTCPNGFSCPSGQICCPGVNGQVCATSVELCPCSYAGNCPLNSCCTTENGAAGGHCTTQPVLANGTQVCPNCQDFNGVKCPNNAVCCPNGVCAANAAACTCTYAGQCPSGYCCTTEFSGSGGQCTNQPVLSNGTQVCPNCNDFNGVKCPNNGVCCPNGSCASSADKCSCNYSSQCPSGYCCTTESFAPGSYCTNQPVLSNGTQICPNCNSFNGLQCPNNQVCCRTGSCSDSVEACSCAYAGQCASGFCCTTESSEPGAHCTSQPFAPNGTQVCPNCNDFNGLQCGTNQVCCPNGACADSPEGCGCTYAGQCPSGYCCTTETGAPGGHCTSQAVLANGTQVCPNCNDFNGVQCPNDQVCCRTGGCADSVEACACSYAGQCPSGFCCTTESGAPGGHCSSQVVLANGTQVCPNCNDLNGLSCPSNAQMCCQSGSCAATPDGCTCSYAGDCPFGYCCTTESGAPGGHCTNQVIQPGGVQACPNCRDFNGLGCPENGLCCPSGKCAKTSALCNSANGGYDPHFELTGLAGNEKFMFDFHGEPGKTFCMISDATLQVNVQMFGLTEATKVLKERVEEVASFFTGTWMDGLGFLYVDKAGQQQNLRIDFDAALDRAGKPPFSISSNGKDIGFDGTTPWSSSGDGFTKITAVGNRINAVTVSIGDLLELEVEGDSEKELIADPPIHFINFKINKLATSPDVHGFLGQMYAPGAVEERLAMGTLEGLLHREYVEGTDQEYETPGLTDPNCSFKRFGQDPKNVVDGPQAMGDNSAPLLVRQSRRLFSSDIAETAAACHMAVSPAGKGLSIVCK